MRVMLRVSIPVDQGNKALKEGTLAKTISGFVERARPEACYFLPYRGRRTAFFFFDLAEPGALPPITESFFTALNAEIEVVPAMNFDDLKRGLQHMSS